MVVGKERGTDGYNDNGSDRRSRRRKTRRINIHFRSAARVSQICAGPPPWRPPAPPLARPARQGG
eukprot:3041292-Pyramimonas_sp.AAC.1